MENTRIEIMNLFNEMYSDEFKAEMNSVEKNNGVVKNGLIVRAEDSKIAPNIYTDQYELDVESGKISVDEVVKKIYEIAKTHDGKELDLNLSKEFVLENVNYRMVGEKSKNSVVGFPHKDVEDLVCKYEVILNNEELGKASFAVTNSLLEGYDISEEELEEAATKNLNKENFSLSSIFDVLKGSGEFDIEEMNCDLPMYVATNDSKIGGSKVLLRNDLLEKIYEKLGREYYIIPSSLHEVLIINDDTNGVEELREMVRSVNDTELDEVDILSYNVYRYDHEEKALKIA